MRNFKSRLDRKGANALLMGGVILVVVILVALGAMYAIALSNMPDDQTDEDLDGDGKEDPIIGYLHLVVDIRHDNSYLDKYHQEIVETSLALETTAPSMSILDALTFFEKHDQFKLSITISLKGAEHPVVYDEDYDYKADLKAGETKTYTVDVLTGGIRYHGTYDVELTLYNEDSDIAYHETKSFTI